jgi:hypothetical protein
LFSLGLLATAGYPEIAAHNTIRKTPRWGSDAEGWSKNDFAAYVFLAGAPSLLRFLAIFISL